MPLRLMCQLVRVTCVKGVCRVCYNCRWHLRTLKHIDRLSKASSNSCRIVCGGVWCDWPHRYLICPFEWLVARICVRIGLNFERIELWQLSWTSGGGIWLGKTPEIFICFCFFLVPRLWYHVKTKNMHNKLWKLYEGRCFIGKSLIDYKKIKL